MYNYQNRHATIQEDPKHLRVNSLVMRQQTQKRHRRQKSVTSTYNIRSLSDNTPSNTIKVAARFRPLNFNETELMASRNGSEIVDFPQNNEVVLENKIDQSRFTFDQVFGPGTKQEEIFNTMAKETVDDVLQGYNGTIFAYGQTGSGKTYTMMGPDLYDMKLRGIAPRCNSYIFRTISQQKEEIEYTITCSMIEIYKETIRDLLNIEKTDLKIKENSRRGIYIDNLTEVCVVWEDELFEVLSMGDRVRTVGMTRANAMSSRSHMMTKITVKQKNSQDTEKQGKLNLIDLAGSEKVKPTQAKGERLEETKKINQSLSALGNVIYALTNGSAHIPYRDSKLTRLLQESLGGNYKTTLIVNCSTFSKNLEETQSTLKFASRAKRIKNQPKINIKSPPDHYLKIIEQLRTELAQAQCELKKSRKSKVNVNPFDVSPISPKSTFEPQTPQECSTDATSYAQSSGLQTQTFDFSGMTLNSKTPEKTMQLENLNHIMLQEILQQRETAELKLIAQKDEIDQLMKDKLELQSQLHKKDAKITDLQDKLQKAESLAESHIEKQNLQDFKAKYEESNIQQQKQKNEVLGKKVQNLCEALQDANKELTKQITSRRDEIDDKISLSSLSCGKLMNSESVKLDESEIEIILNYSDGSITPELHISHLKNQLFKSEIINHQLKRNFKNLHWKLIVLRGRSKMKTDVIKQQSLQIDHLDKLTERLRETSKELRWQIVSQERRNPFQVISNSIDWTAKGRVLKPFVPSSSIVSVNDGQRIVQRHPDVVSQSISWLDDMQTQNTRMKYLESEVDLYKNQSKQLKDAYLESLNHLKEFKKMLKDVEARASELLSEENEKYNSMLSDMSRITTSENETNGRQISSLTKQLIETVAKYADLKDVTQNELGDTTIEMITRFAK